MRIFFAVFWVLFIFSSACAAHQDRVLKLEANGSIADIPSEFGPGSLKLVFKNKTVSSAQLTLGKNSTEIPSCVLRLLKSSGKNHIQVSASWYHQENNLPFYLNIDFLDAAQNVKSRYKNSYSLLFNLRTSKLIYLRRNSVVDNGKALQGMKIDAGTICTKSEAIQLTGNN
jgi:hypothetical protein